MGDQNESATALESLQKLDPALAAELKKRIDAASAKPIR
jgi:hypothetical protein